MYVQIWLTLLTNLAIEKSVQRKNGRIADESLGFTPLVPRK